MKALTPLILSLAIIPASFHVGEMEEIHTQMSMIKDMLTHSPIPPYAEKKHKIDPIEHSCLATMIYGEARGETKEGKIAVAYSAINRSGKKTLCQVVLAPMQYSIFNNNPALRAAALNLHIEPKQKNVIEEQAWEESLEVAAKVMRRDVPDPTAGATHYLAPKAMKAFGYKYPRWAREYKLVAVVDNHHFYKKTK